jgi:hypothetical protein
MNTTGAIRSFRLAEKKTFRSPLKRIIAEVVQNAEEAAFA